MHKIVKICVLNFTLMMIATAPVVGFAQDQLTLKSDTLDEVEIIADRSDMLPNVARVLATVNANDIAATGQSSVNQLVRTLPSVDLRQRGAFSTQSDLSIRGSSFDQTQILLNGINFSDSKTGHHNLDLCLPLDAIDKIEVLQGTSVPGSIGGAVNLVTDFNHLNSLKIGFSAGMYGYFDACIKAKIGNQKIRSLIAAAHQQSSGYIKNTDFLNTNIFSHTQFNSKTGTFDAQFGFLNKAFGSNGFYSFAYPDEFEQVKSLISALSYKKNFALCLLHFAVSYRRNQDKFELVRGTKTGRNDHLTDDLGAKGDLKINTKIGQTQISAEYKYEHIFSNSLGNINIDSMNVPFEYGVFFLKKATRHIFQANLSHSYIYKNFGITGNISYFYNETFKSDFGFAVDTRYAWCKHFLSFIAVNQSIRIPTFTDLYYKGGGRFGNPDLKPEKSINYEIGTSFKRKDITTSLSLFYRQGFRLIDWAGSNGELHAQNYSNVDAFGGEIQFAYQPNNLPILRLFSLSYSYLNMNKKIQNDMSSYLLDFLNNKLNINVLHDFYYKNLTLNWNVSLYDRNGFYTDYQSGQRAPFKPFVLLNAKLNWEYKWLNLYVSAENVTNTKYFDFGGLIQQRFFVRSGIVIKLGNL
jgi:iron complex outermembrane receptor protein